MYIRNLVEDTVGENGMGCEHGLSFYAETPGHKLLFDVGATGLFLENARRAGIDLGQVDTVIISHGHYDHGGGLAEFLKINKKAKIYLRSSAFVPHVSIHGETIHAIGLDQGLRENPRLHFLSEPIWLDQELFLFGDVTERKFWADSNRRLRLGEEGFPQDNFDHEQNLFLRAEGKEILFAGCSHCGIVNILEKCRKLTGTEPDAVIGGLHLMNPRGSEEPDQELIDGTAEYLAATKARYFTGHCTGTEAFLRLREKLGEKITYVHTGEEVLVSS